MTYKTKITIEKDKWYNTIIATYDDGSTGVVGLYYPDEISFCQSEFLGLTREEAMDLMIQKNIAYLRS